MLKRYRLAQNILHDAVVTNGQWKSNDDQNVDDADDDIDDDDDDNDDDDINDDDDAALLRRPCIPCVRSRLRTVLLRDHVIWPISDPLSKVPDPSDPKWVRNLHVK